MEWVEIRADCSKIITPRAKKIYEENSEADFAFQVGEVARFRVNVFRRMGKVSMAIRFISMKIPKVDELRLPSATIKKIAENGRKAVNSKHTFTIRCKKLLEVIKNENTIN